MISNNPGNPGVVPEAKLYSSATDILPNGPQPFTDTQAALAAQHVANQDSGNVAAINLSFAHPRVAPGSQLDGNQLITQFVDWSAAEHNVLYVVSGRNTTTTQGAAVPADNYNGITVAASARVGGGAYRKVAAVNDFSDLALGTRGEVSLIAPGENVTVPGLNNVPDEQTGRSFAAPHVTGTAALSREYADERVGAGAANWSGTHQQEPTAYRHEVMKAVLLNSADKLIDDGTVMFNGSPIPQGNLLGMERTVLRTDDSTWLDSDAFDNFVILPPGASFEGGLFPLDLQMGAGHLNAKRALQQFLPGEHEPDGAAVPPIGWDYGTTTGTGDINKYPINQQLTAGSFISITLAWDRLVEFDNDAGVIGQYDAGDTFKEHVEDDPLADDVISDLELHLLPAGSFSTNQAEAFSVSVDSTVEHIFFPIQSTDMYEI